MMSFLIFLLASIGLTLIINLSFIFKPLREKMCKINSFIGKLLKCSQCTGFWASLFVQFLVLIHERASFIFFFTDIYFILYGFIGSFVCYLVYLLIKPLIDKYD